MRKPNRFAAVIATAVAALVAAACGPSHRPPSPSEPMQIAPAEGPAPVATTYLLQPGDVVSVKFYFNPELNEEVVIRPDGMISLQLVGDIAAASKTATGLADELTQRYTAELARPKVAVIVRQLGGKVFVGGEVGRQGVLPMGPGMTVYAAIQEAGGFLVTAQRKQVVLIRRSAEGRPLAYSIDARPIESGEHPETDLPLQAFDIVFVPKSPIGDLTTFVDLYIRRMLPVPIPYWLF